MLPSLVNGLRSTGSPVDYRQLRGFLHSFCGINVSIKAHKWRNFIICILIWVNSLPISRGLRYRSRVDRFLDDGRWTATLKSNISGSSWEHIADHINAELRRLRTDSRASRVAPPTRIMTAFKFLDMKISYLGMRCDMKFLMWARCIIYNLRKSRRG